MATVIRSAQISGEMVTLSVQNAPAPTLPDRQQPVQQVVAKPLDQTAQADLQNQQAPDGASVAMRERERQLLERERLIAEELEGQRQRVREEARAEGFKHGEAEAAKLYRERLDALHNLIESSREEFSKEISGLEDVVVGIVFEAVCKIIGASMHDREGVRAVVREVMGRVKDQEKLVLRVSPRDYDLLCQNRDELFGAGQGVRHELVSDDRVDLGGCLIETSGGTLDGRLEIQMQQLREVLLGARKMLPE